MRLAEKLPQTYTRWFKVCPSQTQGCTRIQKQQTGGRPRFKEFDVLIPRLEWRRNKTIGEGWVHGHWIWIVWRNSINCSFPSERAPSSCFRPGKPTPTQHLKSKSCLWVHRRIYGNLSLFKLWSRQEKPRGCVSYPELLYRTFSSNTQCPGNPSPSSWVGLGKKCVSRGSSLCFTLNPPTRGGRDFSAPVLCGYNP